MAKYKIGSSVYWKWMGREILGTIEEIYLEPIVKLIKNKQIKRNGSKENPAYLVKSEAGNYALKLGTELIKKSKKDLSYKGPKPKMFS